MRSPIKILHVVFSLDPGGMENGVVNLARGLNGGFETHFCCLERPGAFVERLPRPDRVYVLDKPKGFHASAVLRLSKLIHRLKPDVIHTHNLGPLIYSSMATAGGLFRPILHGEHSLLTDDECGPRRVRQRKVCYRACKKAHSVSEGLRQQLIELGLPGGKIATVLNGVDADKFSPDSKEKARQDLNLPVRAKVLGLVGRFGPFKRHAAFLEAFEQLAARNPDLHVLIVGGGGPEKDRIHAQVADSSHKNRIHLAGFQNDLPRFYRAMDLLVVPSINEGLSNAVLEAMACGVPALANATCGNSEIIINGCDGVIADLATSQKIATEVDKVITRSQELPLMGQRARESVVQNFSLTKMMENYQRLYEIVAGRSINEQEGP